MSRLHSIQTFKSLFVKGEESMRVDNNDSEKVSGKRYEWATLSKFSALNILNGRLTLPKLPAVAENMNQEIEIPLPDGLDDANNFNEEYRETRQLYEQRRDEFERNMKVI